MRRHLVLSCGAILLLLLLLAGAWFSRSLWLEGVGDTASLDQDFPAAASELRAQKKHWSELITQAGAEQAYAVFLEEAPKKSLDTHAQAHAFGEALYESEGLEGLRVCDASFEFGCYHSFFGLAVNAEGIGALPKFDEACKSKYGNDLPCQHGIGHGILVYTDYDNLQDALELCETISSLPTGGCSSGVFMEYNFHTMESVRGGDYLREPTENLYEPCDTLPQRFQASCYFEQVQWWQAVFKDDFARIGELCAALPAQSAEYTACYNGVGNYIAASAAFDYDRMVALCGAMPGADAQGLCHEGASWLVRAVEGKEALAPKLCEALEEPYQSQCLQKLE